MSKNARLISLTLLLLLCSLGLAACGNETPSEIAPYTGARTLPLDQASTDSVKTALKGIKEVKLETFAIKDDPALVKAYYEVQYKDKGWADQKDKVAEVARQQQTPGGWTLIYEKGGKLTSLVLTPGNAASAKFPTAQGENVLVILSGAK